jgi:ElaB/YqjD/DUF883 family membrane-anchored ribosome-binding protein
MSQNTTSSDSGSSPTDRLASMAHETIDRVTPKATQAERELRAAAARAADATKRLQEDAVEATEEHLRKARSYIASNPLTTATVAFAAGVALGALFRRR